MAGSSPPASSAPLLFASSNVHKYREARSIAAGLGIGLEFLESDLEEIQSDSLACIALRKARDAFAISRRPVIVEDDGLFVDSLGGFPGPYSSYVFGTIGNDGILGLLGDRHGGGGGSGSGGSSNTDGHRRARFVSVIAYCDGAAAESFCGTLEGAISGSPRGRGWGYDPIFVPAAGNTEKRTLAELGRAKDGLSHRYMALRGFSSWWHLRNRRRSSGP